MEWGSYVPTTLNVIFSVTNSKVSCSILIVCHGVVSLTLNVAITITYQVIFHPNFIQSAMTIFHHKLVTREGRGSANG
jgi:hypothetical protein